MTICSFFSIYIYVCIMDEMGSSYTWCNSTRVTPFLSRRFMRVPTDKNKTLFSIITLNTYLINSLLIISSLIKYFLCLFFSLLIKSFFPFSLQFLLRFNFFFLLNITFLILLWERYLKAYYCVTVWHGSIAIRSYSEVWF